MTHIIPMFAFNLLLKFSQACVCLCGLILTNTAQASSYVSPAAPSHEQITTVFNQQLAQKLLFHRPFEFPVKVRLTDVNKVKQLDAWVALGVVTKKRTKLIIEKMMYGEPRQLYVGGFEYDLNTQSPWVGDGGIFYGRASIQEIFSVGKVTDIAGEYFSEVYLSWQVNDMPDWVAKMDLKQRQNRILRRALESHKRPFEKRLPFILQQGKWGLWQGRGSKTPQTLP